MDLWGSIVAAGVGVGSTLLVQYASRRVTRRDKVLDQRRRWVDGALNSLRAAWSVRPFDPENIATFLPESPSRELRYSDPSAIRISLYLGFRMHILSADLKKRQRDNEEYETSPFLLYEEHMAKTEPLLAGWALGKLRYGPRAVERWVWASADELGVLDSTTMNAKEMSKYARRNARANRPRP